MVGALSPDSRSENYALTSYYDSFGEFKAAIDGKIREANTSLKHRMKSLLTLNFQILPNDPDRIL